MVRDLERLSQNMQSEIHREERRLTREPNANALPILADFELNGTMHRVYYVAHDEMDGSPIYEFVCLIY